MSVHGSPLDTPHQDAPAPWQLSTPGPRGPRDVPRTILIASGIALGAPGPAWILASLLSRVPGLRAITPALGAGASTLLALGAVGILASAPAILQRRTPPGRDPRAVRRLRALAAVLLVVPVLMIGLVVLAIVLFIINPLNFLL